MKKFPAILATWIVILFLLVVLFAKALFSGSIFWTGYIQTATLCLITEILN